MATLTQRDLINTVGIFEELLHELPTHMRDRLSGRFELYSGIRPTQGPLWPSYVWIVTDQQKQRTDNLKSPHAKTLLKAWYAKHFE